MGQPLFIQTATNSGGIAQAPNAQRDGSGNHAEIIACSTPNGLRIDRIRFCAADDTVENLLRVYLMTGIEKRLIAEIPVAAVTTSDTVPAWSFDWKFDIPLILQDGYSLVYAPSTGTARYHASVVSGGEL